MSVRFANESVGSSGGAKIHCFPVVIGGALVCITKALLVYFVRRSSCIHTPLRSPLLVPRKRIVQAGSVNTVPYAS